MSELYQNYQLIARIGRRTTSSLYLARSRPTPGEKVVIKIFDAIHLREEHEQESFLQELEYLLQLRHPHIVPILDGGIDKYRPYLVSVYAPGGSLRDRLAPQLPFDEALHLITQVGQALAYAHRWDILHANIKPENILFSADDEPLLGDFTFYTLHESSRLTQKPDLRTVRYMAPEQFTGRSEKESDQYALGCLAYELLTGHPPFSAAAVSTWQAKHTSERPAPPSRSVAGLPAYIDAVLLKALAKDPFERYENVPAFIEALTTPALYLPPIPFFADDEEEKGPEPMLLTAGTYASTGASQAPIAASTGRSRVVASIGQMAAEGAKGTGRLVAAIGDVLLHGSSLIVWRTGIILAAATLILMSMALIPLLAPAVAGPGKPEAYAAPSTQTVSTPTLTQQTPTIESTTVPVIPTITPSPEATTPTEVPPLPTPAETQEATPEPTIVPTPTPTGMPEGTPEPTVLPTPITTPEPTLEATSTPFVVLAPTPTPTITLEPTPTPTFPSSSNPTPTPTAKPLPTPTPKPTQPTPKPTPTPVVPTPTPTPIIIPTPTPIVTPTPTPTPIPEPTPTSEPTPIPTLEPTLTPEPTQEPVPTPTPIPEPTSTPEPTLTPEPALTVESQLMSASSEGSNGEGKDKGKEKDDKEDKKAKDESYGTSDEEKEKPLTGKPYDIFHILLSLGRLVY